MTQLDLATYRGMLETAQRRLELSLRSRDGIAIERAADPSDEAQHALDLEMTSRTLDRESGQLAAIKVAYQRIHEGRYGICEHCEEEIGDKRLAAVPWTSYCLRCQEDIDENGSHQLGWGLDLNAA